jgi:SAM-dependent methyltransferase
MPVRTNSPADLQQIYQARFAGKSAYRLKVWESLCSYFSRWIPPHACVLDLGCGWCEFINTINCDRKFAMDLNPDAERLAGPQVRVLRQDCSEPWLVATDSLDVVFTSNFLEHLPSKDAVARAVLEAHRALKPGGLLIAMGPNIKYLPGSYWDFFDHYVPLTELSLSEVLTTSGFLVDVCHSRFLPYTMSDGREFPIWMLRLYLSMPFVWRVMGKQFLIVARKPERTAHRDLPR